MQMRITEPGLGDWDDIRIFLAVLRSGSYSKAATVLGTRQSTVSRRIQSMEESLGVKLFDRYSHGMRPTPAARAIRHRAEVMEAEALSIERQLVGTDAEMEGVVRVTGTEFILTYWLVHHVRGFYDRHPRIRLELISSSDQLDLGAREADIALRFGQPTEPRLVARRIGSLEFGFFASRTYAWHHGLPGSVEEIRNHRILDYTGFHKADRGKLWARMVDKHDSVVLSASSAAIYLRAMELGLGIGMLPRFMGTTSASFIDLGLDFGYSMTLYLVTHEETNKSARIRAFSTYLNEVITKEKGQWFK